MDIEILKKRIKALEGEQASINAAIVSAKQKVQVVLNEHNSRVTFLTSEVNKLAGKIDILKELVNLEDPVKPKKGK